MKKATNIHELANNLNPEKVLSKEDKDFYVPIYDNILETLRDQIINNELENQTVFVVGQAGTGKTTALNFLENEEMSNRFIIKHIRGMYLFDPYDIHIIDLLLIFAHELIKDTTLQDKYYNKLDELQKIHEGVLIKDEEITNERHPTLNIGTKFFANYQMESHIRKTTRKIFIPKKRELLEMINNIIDEFYEKEIKDNKKLLVIIDDLEKLRIPEQIDSLFIDNRHYISQLKCKKIIPIPVHITTHYEVLNLNVSIQRFGLMLSSNPIDKSQDKEKIENIIKKNKDMLRQIIKYRIHENYQLIEDNVIEEVIQYSGGVIKQFIRILYGSAVTVRKLKGQKISKNDVESSCQELGNLVGFTIISGDTIKLLEEIRTKNKPSSEFKNSDEFIKALLGTQILAYSNGYPWYEVNPLIEKMVRLYADTDNK